MRLTRPFAALLLVALLLFPVSAAFAESTPCTPAQAILRALSQGELPANGWLCDGKPGKSVLDMAAVRNCKTFTMRLQAPKAEDALVVAGGALAWGRPSVYLVPQRKDLPWFLREAEQSYPGQVRVIEGADPATELRKGLPVMKAWQSSQMLDEPKVSTFIGCLMSGLTEAQYAEGRKMLQEIDEALIKHFDSRDNFCEGIRIASPSNFDTPREALVRDLSAVRNSLRCVFYVHDATPRPSGMWVEVGAAIAMGKHCTFLVPDRAVLPRCLQSQNLPDRVRVVVYKDHASLHQMLKVSAEEVLGL